MHDINNIPKTNIFKVPSDYFENLPSRTQERLLRSERPNLVAFQNPLAVKVSIITIVVLISSLLLFNRHSPTAEPSLSSVDSNDIIMFLGEKSLSFDDLIETVPVDYDLAEELYMESIYELDILEAEKIDFSDYEYLDVQEI